MLLLSNVDAKSVYLYREVPPGIFSAILLLAEQFVTLIAMESD